MANINVCDLCHKEVLADFSDTVYRVTKRGWGFDGLTPHRCKWSVDVCPKCMRKIVAALPKEVSK